MMGGSREGMEYARVKVEHADRSLYRESPMVTIGSARSLPRRLSDHRGFAADLPERQQDVPAV